MTSKEAIEQLKSILETGVTDADVLLYTEDYEAIDYAINSLEQKPCDDAISRQALRQKLREHHDFFVNAYGGFNNLSLNDKFRVDEITNCIAMVVNAPSVTPQPKVGEWLKNGELCKCSNCHSNVLFSDVKLYNFCYRCGAKMEVEG